MAPLRPIAAITQGWGISQLYRLLGGAPAPLVKRGYQLVGIDKYLMKPWTVLSNLHDRELLAQIEAVDAFMDRMHAYPGRTFGQLYHRFFRTNDLADGRLALEDRTLDLADVKLPVLAVAGRGDGIAPVPACHHVEALLPHAKVELATAPGGHLGVLTGRAAARDDLEAARRLPRQACNAPCKAREAAGGRGLSGYPQPPMRPSHRPHRAPPPRPRRTRRRPGAADRAPAPRPATSTSAASPSTRRSSKLAAELQRLARRGRSSVHVAGHRYGLTMTQAQRSSSTRR